MPSGEEVKSLSLYREKHILFHGYVFPFIALYVAAVVGWMTTQEEWSAHAELLYITLAAIAALNVVTCLFCVWSVHVRCALSLKRVASVKNATLVKVVPTPNNGSTELVQLIREQGVGGEEDGFSFLFQKVRYVYCREQKQFSAVKFPTGLDKKDYLNTRGLNGDVEIEEARKTFGKNSLEVSSPEFWVLFKERATAPFFVFQVFCVGLWCLDEYWYYSMFTLVMLVLFEALLVQQQKRNLSEIRKMGPAPHPILVHRGNRWTRLLSDQLLPGDIVSIGRSRDGRLVPCDLLLLRGSCVVDESMLTGESVPQMKEPLESCLATDECLNIERDGRLHVVFGGTKLVQHSAPSKTGLRASDNGCTAYVLRTGFSTSQGKLLRTILYGVQRVTANNLETFMFILFLLIFAIIAAAYVWVKGTENPERNRYKLFLECTLLLTSVVPPELPIELSLAVNTSLISLAKTGIYCTEPFRIPFGGKVDICCFDKTGTLTSNSLVVKGVATSEGLVAATDSSVDTQWALASCHSIALVDGEEVGDPLEKAGLHAVQWRLSKSDTVVPSHGKRTSLHILQRFHFSSALKRMSTISSVTTPSEPAPHYISAVKGAPEVLKDMFVEVPDNYDSVYLKFARKGARVLALGIKNYGKLSMSEASSLKREDAESNLVFAGFLVIVCPLKSDSQSNIQQLKESSHHVVMITGDNPLTACHVAKELKMSSKKLLILSGDDDDHHHWESVSGAISLPLDLSATDLRDKYDLCLTGDGMAYLLRDCSHQRFLSFLPHVRVFARVSPKQKEQIVTSYKALGYHTLMCGDGTNDVGALKHAHVGVSLLSTVKLAPKPKDSTQQSPPTQQQLTRSPLRHRREGTGGVATSGPASQSAVKRNKLLQDLLRESEEKLSDPALVRLGDASIASPFTSRESSIACICHVIKQGRCTLVTTLQMFKILALNALILAYSQSVLYLDGIKFSDVQATLQGVLLAGCFLFISRSKPLKTLSKERPLPNIFNLYTILTVCVQFAIHFTSLVYLVGEAKKISPPVEGFVDLEKEFEENVLNSAVYLISVAMQISNFAINYKGHPFMVSLVDNKPLLYSILITATVVLVLAAGLFPDLSAYLQVVDFPEEFRTSLVMVLIADYMVSFAADRLLSVFLGTATLRKY